MKRWLSAALTAALMICLAACGRAPGETAAESVLESEAFGQTEETAAASQETGNAEGGSQAVRRMSKVRPGQSRKQVRSGSVLQYSGDLFLRTGDGRRSVPH